MCSSPCTFQNNTQDPKPQCVCSQYLHNVDLSRTYSGYFYVRTAVFDPQPPNADFTGCAFGAGAQSVYIVNQHLSQGMYRDWTKLTFSNVTLAGQYGQTLLQFGLFCDSGYIGPGKIELLFDTFFLAPDTC